MFCNLDNHPALFEEYKLSKEQLNSCRKRLLAVQPYLCINNEEDQNEDLDWDDIYFIVKDDNQIICVVPNHYEVNMPQIFVLSDERDYEMSDKEIFDFLTMIHETHPEFKLSHIKFTPGDDLTGLLFNVWSYLESPSKEPESFSHYDNYYPCVARTHVDVDVEEALHLVQIVLTTVYNYDKKYQFTEEDLDLLS